LWFGEEKKEIIIMAVKAIHLDSFPCHLPSISVLKITLQCFYVNQLKKATAADAFTASSFSNENEANIKVNV
jgi:hypothetical protein